MERIYQLVREQITPELTELIAKDLKSDKENIGYAVSSVFAGFLVLTQMKGQTCQICKVFEEAGSLNMASRLESVCTGPLTPQMLSVGDNFLQHVLGDRASNFTSLLSLQTGLSKVAVNMLIARLAPVFAGYIGDKIVSSRWSLHKVLGMINTQKDSYRDFIPESFV